MTASTSASWTRDAGSWGRYARTRACHPRLLTRTDEAVILLALQPRISCNCDVGLAGDAVNAGIGLPTTYRIVRAASGHMVIVSGAGVVRLGNVVESHAWRIGVTMEVAVSAQALIIAVSWRCV